MSPRPVVGAADRGGRRHGAPQSTADDERSAHRDPSARLADAFPLLAAALAFGLLAFLLRPTDPTHGGLASVWWLFAALAIIAGMGAAASWVLDEGPAIGRPRDEARTSPGPEPAPLPEPSTDLPPAHRRPTGRSGAAFARPVTRPVWLESPDDSENAAARGALRLDGRSARPPRREATRDPRDPGEVLGEIEVLWRELEATRRRRPRRGWA